MAYALQILKWRFCHAVFLMDERILRCIMKKHPEYFIVLAIDFYRNHSKIDDKWVRLDPKNDPTTEKNYFSRYF